MPAKQIKGSGGLPSGKTFGEDKAAKERELSARQAGAARLAMQYGIGDFIGDIAEPAGAIIGAVATKGSPEGAKTGAKIGKVVGDLAGGQQEEREANYQRLMGQQPVAQEEEDPFAAALSLYQQISKKDKEKKVG
jgi:hypothetical protein